LPIDKNRADWSFAKFDEITRDPNVQIAIRAIQNIKDPAQVDKLAEVLPLIRNKYEGNMGTLNALTALSKGITLAPDKRFGTGLRADVNKTFKSDVTLEIDGISNGFAINLLQFPIFKTQEILKRHLNQIGSQFGDTEYDPLKPDAYTELANLLQVKFSTNHSRPGQALMNLYPALVDGDLRNLIKYPFLIFLYGGEIKKILEGIGSNIVTALYKDLNTLQLLYSDTPREGRPKIRARIELFAERLNDIGAFSDTSLTQKSLVSAMIGIGGNRVLLNDINLKKRIGLILKEPLKESFTEMLGGIAPVRSAVVIGGFIQDQVFQVHLEHAIEAEKIRTGRKNFTETEIDDIIKADENLLFLLPQSEGPLSAQETGNNKTHTALHRRGTSQDISNIERVEYDHIGPNGTKVTTTSNPRQSEFQDSGLSVLIRQIINIDSAIMTSTLNLNPNMLMLHDAKMGSPVDLDTASVNYGEFFDKFGKEVNILQETLDRAEAVIARTKENHPEFMKEIEQRIKDNAHSNQGLKESKKSNLKTFLGLMRISNNDVRIAKEKIADLEVTEGKLRHEQLRMPRSEGTEKPTFISEQRQLVAASVKEALRRKEDLTQAAVDGLNIAILDNTRREGLRKLRSQSSIDSQLDKELNQFLTPESQQELAEKAQELLTLNNLPRTNPKNVLIEDIGQENINSFFELFNSFSDNYYQNDEQQKEHTDFLRSVLHKLSKGMTRTKRIHLTQEHIDGITQGQYNPRRESMRVSLSRIPPITAAGQSPQEVYVHEMLHAMTSFAITDDRLLGARIENIFDAVKAELDAGIGSAVFLTGIEGTPSTADIDLAKQQYNYVFDNTLNEKNKLSEFLAYATTNRALITYLSNRTPGKPLRETGFIGKLLAVVDLVVDKFVKALNHAFGNKAPRNSYMDLLAITEHLVAVQSKHQSKLAQLQTKVNNFLDKTDQKIQNFADKQSTKIINTNSRVKIKQVALRAIKAPLISLSTDPKIIKKRREAFDKITLSANASALNARQAVFGRMNTTLRSLVSEIGGGVLSKDMIEQLLHAKVNVSKARQVAERFTISWFNDIWKSVDATDPKGMSVQTREALTHVMFRTDMSSLRGVGLSHKRIADLINNPRQLTIEKNQILNQLGLKKDHEAVQYAEELGNHMMTGNTLLENAHMNAHSIVLSHLPEGTEADRALLDAYATIVAMEAADTRKGELVNVLATNEFSIDPNENGFIDLIDSHMLFKANSIRDLFDDNPTQSVKGFLIERVDNLTSVQTGTKEEAKQQRKAGFTESVPLGSIPGIDQTHNTLYIARNIPAVPFASGVMSTTNIRNMGTTLTEIFAQDPAYKDADGNVVYAKINKDIKKIIKDKAAAVKKSIKIDPKIKLRPVWDDKNNITDYRVIMTHAIKPELLRPDLEIQNVFAHMNSAYVDRKTTIKSDEKVVEILVHEQADILKSHDKVFVDFLDKKYADRYRRIPRAARKYMESFAIDGKFMVREDVIDKVFGFKVFDLSQLGILQSPSLAGVKRFAGLTHYFIREIVGYGKDRIVIAMPAVVLGNTFSNITQLTMKKIPLAYTIHKTLEGFKEYQRYRADTEEFNLVKHRKDSKNIPDASPEGIRLAQLKIRIENNKIHRMSAAGLNSLIVEDVNEASSDGYFHRLRQSLKLGKYSRFADKVPTSVNKVAATLFMTKSSKPYQVSRTVVQLTDFLARYVMIEYYTKVKGVKFEVALHSSLDAFVLFDETLTPVVEALDAVGFTSFISYFLRNQRASRQLVQSSPTSVGLSAITQSITGIPTLGNVNSSIFGGDFSPNLWQLDDLFDEANNLTGADLLADLLKSIFG
jgi:hypothetical protein